MQLMGKGGSSFAHLCGAGLIIAGTAWYPGVETKWLSRTVKVSVVTAFATAIGLFLAALVMVVIVAVGVGITPHQITLPAASGSA